MTHVNRTIGAALAAIAVGLFRGDDLHAQPGPPVINRVELNGGAATTTSDQVTMEYFFDHPAAIGNPIPFYRIRKKSPDGPFPPWGPYEANVRGVNKLTVVLVRRNGVTPIPGLHTVELQIKDGLGQESAVASASIQRVVPPPPPAQYTLTGSQVSAVLVLAEQRSYKWFVTPRNANSQCSRDDAPTNAPGVALHVFAKVPLPGGLSTSDPRPECQFRFLQGKPLQAGWRLLRVGLNRCPAESCQLSLDGQAAGFTIVKRVEFVGGAPARPAQDPTPNSPVSQGSPAGWYYTSGEVIITELVFQGPSGAQWQDAFVP